MTLHAWCVVHANVVVWTDTPSRVPTSDQKRYGLREARGAQYDYGTFSAFLHNPVRDDEVARSETNHGDTDRRTSACAAQQSRQGVVEAIALIGRRAAEGPWPLKNAGDEGDHL